jgi:hypothetical protein
MPDDEKSEFDAFIKRQQQQAATEQSIDWARERDEWLQHLAELYKKVETFLKDHIKSGAIAVTVRNTRCRTCSIIWRCRVARRSKASGIGAASTI